MEPQKALLILINWSIKTMGYVNGGMEWCFRIPGRVGPEDNGLFENYIECRACRYVGLIECIWSYERAFLAKTS